MRHLIAMIFGITTSLLSIWFSSIVARNMLGFVLFYLLFAGIFLGLFFLVENIIKTIKHKFKLKSVKSWLFSKGIRGYRNDN